MKLQINDLIDFRIKNNSYILKVVNINESYINLIYVANNIKFRLERKELTKGLLNNNFIIL